MSEFDSLHPLIQTWVFAHETLRRLGFPSDELYLAAAPFSGVLREPRLMIAAKIFGGATAIAMVIRRGELEFTWTLGIAGISIDEARAQHARAVEIWNSGNGPDIVAWRRWLPTARVTDLVSTLQHKGFYVASFPDLTTLTNPEDDNGRT